MSALLQDEEHDIIERCRKGDSDAYAVLVDRYRSLAYTVACRMLGDADLANDIAQESFFAAYSGIRQFRYGSKFSSWLTSIVLNKCRDHIRSRRPTVGIDEIAEIRATGRRDPEQEAMDGQTADAVQRALNGLAPDYREAVILKHIEELDYQTMSEILGVSIAALKVRTHRGREMLKGLLMRSGVTP